MFNLVIAWEPLGLYFHLIISVFLNFASFQRLRFKKKKTFVFCVIFFSFFCFWFYYVSCWNSMESIYNLLYVYAFIKHILTAHFRLLTLWIWTTTRKICFFFFIQQEKLKWVQTSVQRILFSTNIMR